jgi:ABC-type proline/glycine betaine transport system permease subunit
LTSVVSSLGGGGVTNHISNAANNQLVQQVITANIGITGLGHAIQQGVASAVMSRVQAANAQFR